MNTAEIWAAARSTLKETSLDDTHHVYMSESLLSVYDFDAVKDSFVKAWYKRTGNSLGLKSNDAFYIDAQGQPYFIEFKNKAIRSKGSSRIELKQKIYDSFFISNDVGLESLLSDFEASVKYSRQHIDYILVYAEEANEPRLSKDRLRYSMLKKAHLPRFGMEKYEGFLYRHVYTLTEREFQEQFVSRWEEST